MMSKSFPTIPIKPAHCGGFNPIESFPFLPFSKRDLNHLPSNQEKLPQHFQSSHSYEDPPDSHSFTEANHNSGLRQPVPKLLQQSVETLFSSVTVDLVRMSNAKTFLSRQLFERFHATLAIIS